MAASIDGPGAEGGSGDEEESASMSLNNISDEIGDIVPGLEMEDFSGPSTPQMGPQKSKAKRPVRKGRNMGKFGRGRNRAGASRRQQQRGMVRKGVSKKNVKSDEDGIEMAESNKPNSLIPMGAQDSVTLTVNAANDDVEQDLDNVLNDLGYEE